MQVTPIYTKTLREIRNGTRTIVHQGGQWSGKTVNILGALSTICSEDECDPFVATVTATSVPHLRGGALRDFEMYVYPSFASSIKKYHRTDKILTFRSGHQLEFKSFENEQAARGSKRKYLFVNEANAINQLIFFQLNSRTSGTTIIDYNPSVRFWAHDQLIGQPGTKTFYSDHRHNPFLTPDKHREIENIYNFESRKGDLELWKVYARGLTGNIEGVIFPNWGND
jgi:phage terminase large subunit